MSRNRFSNISNNYSQHNNGHILKRVANMIYPIGLYAAAFYFGLSYKPLLQSPLLHFSGGVFSFTLNVLTLVVTFISGFITGFFEANKESLTMFPFNQGMIRVVIGGVFIIATFLRIIRISLNQNNISGFDILTHLYLSIGLLIAMRYFNEHLSFELTTAEQVFITIGYFVFYVFQSGKDFSPQRSNVRTEPE